jgi:hypothetical protein
MPIRGLRLLCRCLSIVAFASLALAAAPVQAATATTITPQNGYWWNPAQPGRGYVIEIQGTTLFMAGFLYSSSGEATWVATTGQMLSSSQYVGSLVTYSGGQTLTGSYQAPTLAPSLGDISITFTANNQGTISWPGGTVPIQRFDIVPGGSSTAQPATNPQTGWWWDPSQSGRGFAFEMQGGQAYFAAYMYDASGNPTWYLANGSFANSTFTGVWQQYAGGQTMTGPFQFPGLANANVGSVTLQFTDATHATLTLPNNQQIAFGRYQFATGPVLPVPIGLWQPAAGSVPSTGSYVYLEGDPGDYVSGGNTYTYTLADALIQLTASGDNLAVTVTGNQSWNGDFLAMSTISQLQPGYYGNLTRFPFENPYVGGLSWTGQGNGCNTLTGWFAVDAITYTGGNLAEIDLRFEQHCEGASPALRGNIHWNINDTATTGSGGTGGTSGGTSGGPTPIPPGLWMPGAGSTPATGNYIYLVGQSGDYVSGGLTNTYTQSNSVITLDATSGLLAVTVDGNDNWTGDFQTMDTISQLQVGYYGNLMRYPFDNPVLGGLSWYGDGRGCNTLTGWFAVDDVAYNGSNLASIDLRFEQHCEGAGPALDGKIHWSSTDTSTPGGPSPIPAGLWQPAAGSTPASGNYVYLTGQAGDYIIGANTFIYTQANATLQITGSSGLLSVTVTGNDNWTGDFQTMNTINQLQVGYYPNLERWPFNNPATGGLSWYGDGRGCNTLSGWFVVDNVVYTGGSLTAIDLRFEQHCEGAGPAMDGQIHWNVNDTTAPGGPVFPVPTGLWQPPAGSTPASGNYVYLQSDSGDYIGAGQTLTYTPATNNLVVSVSGILMTVNVYELSNMLDWTGDFEGMNTLSQLQAGYYGGVERYPFNNPTTGGLSWYGEGRGCNTLTGWFAVDDITFSNGDLTAIDVRFEQHCEGGTPALHGQIHWTNP